MCSVNSCPPVEAHCWYFCWRAASLSHWATFAEIKDLGNLNLIGQLCVRPSECVFAAACGNAVVCCGRESKSCWLLKGVRWFSPDVTFSLADGVHKVVLAAHTGADTHAHTDTQLKYLSAVWHVSCGLRSFLERTHTPSRTHTRTAEHNNKQTNQAFGPYVNFFRLGRNSAAEVQKSFNWFDTHTLTHRQTHNNQSVFRDFGASVFESCLLTKLAGSLFLFCFVLLLLL